MNASSEFMPETLAVSSRGVSIPDIKKSSSSESPKGARSTSPQVRATFDRDRHVSRRGPADRRATGASRGTVKSATSRAAPPWPGYSRRTSEHRRPHPRRDRGDRRHRPRDPPADPARDGAARPPAASPFPPRPPRRCYPAHGARAARPGNLTDPADGGGRHG